MTFPKIDEDFMDTQLSTFGEVQDTVHDFLDTRISKKQLEEIVKEDMLDLQLQSIDGAFSIITESFPRISQMIHSGWGSKELHDKLSHMLHLDTEKRAGFGTPIGLALMKIYQAHMDEFKFDPPGTNSGFRQDQW